MSDENDVDVISTITGYDLDRVLNGYNLPSTSALSSQLGILGIPSLDPRQIYGDKWDDDVVGPDQGEDFEDQVDEELENEEDQADQEMENEESPREASVKVEDEPTESMPKKERRIRVVRRLVERPKSVYERFPTYEKDKILDFTELFKGYTVPRSRVSKRPFQLEPVYPRKRDVPRHFLQSIVGDAERQAENQRADEVIAAGNIDFDLQNALEGRVNTEAPVSLSLQDRSFDLVLLANWEDQIVYEPEEDMEESAIHRRESQAALTTKVNKSLESGAWTQSIIWSPRAPFRDFTQLEVNEEDAAPEERPIADPRPRKRFRSDQVPRDKFNLSNDQYYEVSKEGRGHRVRQTFGQLVVEHAYPAQKLQLPFYKTRLSKQEARSWHRPALQFPSNVEIHFTKVRSAKKKKDKAGRSVGKGGNVSEGLHRTSDLSLKDTSNYVLWEFSEEHPPIMSNFGMGSILVNYYRKKDEKDEHIPKYDLGVPFVLEPQDESPFMKFGYVYPGETVPALYNNLIRAPLFRQKPRPTDFLVIRSTIRGETRYYIREMKNLFVVGQTYPVTEVPGPHSRKITNTIKHRLQNITYKLLSKSHEERLKISRLMKYFPDQNELQMRQRLKEFMEYHRRGPHQGFWRLKTGWQVPSEADQLKMVTPEQVVLSESMQVGQRHLQDLGYSQAAEAENADEAHLSVEQQLAPWITTKNFLFATQAKAMLRLHGEGDPTGRGEAFSFIRVSMKDIFVKAGEDYEQKLAEAEARPKSAHRYNVAEQQLIYKSEIERIWRAQHDSLSRRDEPQLTDEDEKREASQKPQEQSLQRRALDQQYPGMSAVSPKQAGPSAAPSPAYSRGSSVDRDREMSYGPEGAKRVLRIKRLVDGHWQTEIVRDPAVISAYVRRRQIIEEETTLADALAPTGDAEKDARAKKRLEEEIMRMKKNQERRLHRKNAKIAKEGGTPLLLNRPVKPDTTRRCGHCGQMGHMKTNRKCPRWAEFNSGAPPATPSATSPPAGSPPTPSLGNLGFSKSSDSVFSPTLGPSSRPGTSFGFPVAVPSPLATSPPLSAVNDSDLPPPTTGGGSAPKIKLTLKKT